LFRNFNTVDFENCFSAMRTQQQLMSSRCEQVIVTKQKNASTIKIVGQTEHPDRSIIALDGVRTVLFVLVSVLFVNFLQKDMVQSNRWKEVQLINLDFFSWMMVTSSKVYLDLLLMISSFLYSNKLLRYFNRLELNQVNKERSQSDLGHESILSMKQARENNTQKHSLDDLLLSPK
jgi:predicted signal transduction protein with EAL and GGDEF domain